VLSGSEKFREMRLKLLKILSKFCFALAEKKVFSESELFGQTPPPQIFVQPRKNT